jgi:rhamnogalacturonan endolyase
MKTSKPYAGWQALFVAAALLTSASSAYSARQIEQLDRGLVAVKSGSNVFLSWRLFATDPASIRFNVYREGEAAPLNPSPLDAAHTSYTAAAGSASATYSVEVLVGNTAIERSKPVSLWQEQYLNIPVEKPATGHMPDGEAYTDYSIYDGSVGDLDGDGQYEIVFFWIPGNAKDNSQDGYTANVFIDAYKLDGTKLWGTGKFIDLGCNIRAGAHYQCFLVYDFDSDGKAEIIVKTAPGTKDTEGTMLGSSDAYLGVTSGRIGRILAGPEYVSVFEGATGKLLATEKYDPPRHPDTENPSGTQLNSVWGDSYGNRVDRFLAAVAFLDGERPSAVMCRGYYSRTALCAWDWDGATLSKRWLFDTRALGSAGNKYTGQGNHGLSVADVDKDGKDEIIYGALTIDDDGTALYCTGLGHGDAMHVGKLDPSYPDLLVMGVHEEYSSSHTGPVTEVHNARTGEIIWQLIGDFDNGRGITADIDPEYPGEEVWSSASTAATEGVFSITGVKLNASKIGNYNMAIYWDGDVGRELFDGGNNPSVTKVTAAAGIGSNLRRYSTAGIFTFSGASTNGGSKNNPCLQADILGDWREEVILRATDNSALRVYTTVAPTVHDGVGAVPSAGIYTLMQNKAYRLAVAWQNIGYNQPPHTDYFLGYSTTNALVDPGVEKGAGFAVSFDPNGGTFVADGTTAVKYIFTMTGAYIERPDVVREEYDFAGWFFSNGSPYSPTEAYREDVELRAKWTRFYALTFDPNGGTLQGASSRQVSYGEPVGALPVPTPPTDSAFAGWNTARDGSGKTYSEATVYEVSGDLTLYARWRFHSDYTLTLNPNGGALPAADSSRTATYGEAVGDLPAPAREGYTFVSWTTGQDGSGVAYTSATTYHVEDHLTLYAQWRPSATFTITFEPNGGVLPDGAAGSKVVTYGLMVGELPRPTREGHDFAGWNMRQNGSGATYTDSTVCTYDGNFRLYAQWTEHSNGGEPTAVAPEKRHAVKMYPNPVWCGVLTIDNAGLKPGDRVEIFSLSGEAVGVYEVSGGEVTTIDVAHLPGGAYIVKVGGLAEKILKL